MKKKFLNSSMRKIKKKNPDFTEEKFEEIEYGLEALYLTFTKMIIVFGVALILGIFKEVIILMIFYNIIRTTAFGLHATKSIYCLITSIVFFIGGGLFCKYIDIPSYIKIALSIISLLCLIKYAPADTYKRPLINAKKRKLYKFFTIVTGSIYLVLVIVFNNSIISSFLGLGLLEATMLIHPLTYRMFHLPYNNYKNYTTVYN